MLKTRGLLAAALLILLAACSPSADPGDTAPVVTDVACERSYDEPSPMPALVDVFADSDDDPIAATGILIQAPAGTAVCEGNLADGVTCQVRGPAIVRVAIQDFEYFTVPDGRTATLRENAGTDCFLNAD